jgi:hypothetical protein
MTTLIPPEEWEENQLSEVIESGFKPVGNYLIRESAIIVERIYKDIGGIWFHEADFEDGKEPLKTPFVDFNELNTFINS